MRNEKKVICLHLGHDISVRLQLDKEKNVKIICYGDLLTA